MYTRMLLIHSCTCPSSILVGVRVSKSDDDSFEDAAAYSITYAGKCQMVDKFNNGLGQVLFHGIDNDTIR